MKLFRYAFAAEVALVHGKPLEKVIGEATACCRRTGERIALGQVAAAYVGRTPGLVRLTGFSRGQFAYEDGSPEHLADLPRAIRQHQMIQAAGFTAVCPMTT